MEGEREAVAMEGEREAVAAVRFGCR
jgi:hypothetical protein